jgi:hypothetical protein
MLTASLWAGKRMIEPVMTEIRDNALKFVAPETAPQPRASRSGGQIKQGAIGSRPVRSPHSLFLLGQKMLTPPCP